MNNLEKEIEELRHQLSEVIPEELNNIIGSNDNSNNVELCQILERQHYISVRLKQLTDRLYGYTAINLKNIPKNKIGIGSLITVQNAKTGEINNYKLIMSELSNEMSEELSEITLQSPLGKALLNKVIHDEVEIQLFKNKIFYKILNFVTIHDL